MAKKKGGRKGITEKQVAEALRKTAGLISYAADAIGISRQAVHDRINHSPHLQALLKEIRESVKDIAEGNILKSIKGGDTKDSRWYLEQTGEDRGYGNKTKISFGEEAIQQMVAGLLASAKTIEDAHATRALLGPASRERKG